MTHLVCIVLAISLLAAGIPDEPAPATLVTPLPVATLRPGTYKYKGQVKAKTSSAVVVETSIQDESDDWKVTDVVLSDAGKTTITLWLDKHTLTVRKSSLRRGVLLVEMEFKDGKVSGGVHISSHFHPVNGETPPLLAALAGNGAVLACLPLAKGYSVTFQNFDILNQKAQRVRVQVTGTEEVTVPAGRFKTYKVEVTSLESADRTTLWVERATRTPVRAVSWIPQGDGKTVITELTL